MTKNISQNLSKCLITTFIFQDHQTFLEFHAHFTTFFTFVGITIYSRQRCITSNSYDVICSTRFTNSWIIHHKNNQQIE